MPHLVSRRRGLLAALALLGPALAGCSSLPSTSSWFGSGSAAGNANASGAAFTPPADFECPVVEIRQGAGQLSISTNPAEPTAMNQRYQLGFADTARECKLNGTSVTMKVGVRGRVIVGPAGGPGQVDVPLRFAVVREGVDPTTIVTKFQRIPVTVQPNDPNVAFSYVEEDLTFPFPPGGGIDSYVVYIGFDPVTAQEMDRKRKPAPKPPARPRRANTAQVQ
jgi:hypothetical protein